jgi:hypothetical protein
MAELVLVPEPTWAEAPQAQAIPQRRAYPEAEAPTPAHSSIMGPIPPCRDREDPLLVDNPPWAAAQARKLQGERTYPRTVAAPRAQAIPQRRAHPEAEVLRPALQATIALVPPSKGREAPILALKSVMDRIRLHKDREHPPLGDNLSWAAAPARKLQGEHRCRQTAAAPPML